MDDALSQKTLVDLIDALLQRKSEWSIDTKIKLVIGNTELGALHITGKIESNSLHKIWLA